MKKKVIRKSDGPLAGGKAGKGRLEPLRIRHDAAGIDIGATELFAAVSPESAVADADGRTVRSFGTFTADLHDLAAWLKQHGVKTVAMESTGVYWIPVFQILEERGFAVCLVNARHIKNVPGRKTDVADCQWIQQLHSMGLLNASFRPAQNVCALRSILRHREGLVQMSAQQIQLMQKALNQMNLQLHHVLADITGTSGLAILDAILAGERDTARLAALRDWRVKSSARTIARALEGDYRSEHLFTLEQSLKLYRFVQEQIGECHAKVLRELAGWDGKVDLAEEPLGPAEKRIYGGGLSGGEASSVREQAWRALGVDLTRVDGINCQFLQVFLSEVGPDMTRFRSASAFASWLNLCPNQEISGGKVLNNQTGRNACRMAAAFRMAANSLFRSQSALGRSFRRFRSKLGAPKAITAIAHKLARIVYHLVTTRETFDPAILVRQQENEQQRNTARLRKQAARLGFDLVPARVA
jgi:transposase